MARAAREGKEGGKKGLVFTRAPARSGTVGAAPERPKGPEELRRPPEGSRRVPEGLPKAPGRGPKGDPLFSRRENSGSWSRSRDLWVSRVITL